MDPRRALPSVDRVVDRLSGLPHALLVDAARDAIDAAREQVAGGAEPDADAVVRDAADPRRTPAPRLLRPVINATGVLVHTNLGRAPLGDEALAAAAAVAVAASNLEYDLDAGAAGRATGTPARCWPRRAAPRPGSSSTTTRPRCCSRWPHSPAVATSIVSRGELVEIGGGFRVPEVMAESGCRLVEVGTTNRTRLADYERALGDDTALLLKVHASNYRMVGFTEATPVAELGRARPPVMVDAGSGLLDEATPWLAQRAGVAARRARGAPGARRGRRRRDVLGRQAARRSAGRGDRRAAADSSATCPRTHWRGRCAPTSSTLGALQRVALAYLAGDRRPSRCGGWRPSRSTRCATAPTRSSALDGAKVVDTEAVAGGGSFPGLRSRRSASRRAPDADATSARCASPEWSPGSTEGAVVCDLRSVDPRDDATLARRAACRAPTRASMRVVATAGHVDHGKSSLVLALTGTDPDRFAEEKARGLTIDLGFAFTTLASGPRSGSSTCPGTCGSSRTCSPASGRSTSRCSSSPRPRAGSRRARSTSASSSCSACATASSRSPRPTRGRRAARVARLDVADHLGRVPAGGRPPRGVRLGDATWARRRPERARRRARRGRTTRRP